MGTNGETCDISANCHRIEYTGIAENIPHNGLHTGGVTGSIPVLPTIKINHLQNRLATTAESGDARGTQADGFHPWGFRSEMGRLLALDLSPDPIELRRMSARRSLPPK